MVALPFADDSEVISNHQTKHKKLVIEVQAKADSMGLEFKASKYRSLSIKSGTVTLVPFFLKAKDGNLAALKTMEDDPHKSHFDSTSQCKIFVKLTLKHCTT